MNLEQKILQALGQHPLSTEELSNHLGSEVSSDDIGKALYQLGEQKSWIVKHPVIDGGCKTCACHVSYKWRLTIIGRVELRKNNDEEALPESG